MIQGSWLGTFVREWRPAFCSSESQSPFLPYGGDHFSDVGDDRGGNGDNSDFFIIVWIEWIMEAMKAYLLFAQSVI